MMIYEFENIEAFFKASQDNPSLLRSTSPGHVRSVLGITRQAIYGLVKRGSLDEIRIGKLSQHPIILITDESVERFRVSPTRQGQITFRQRIVHAADRMACSWPDDS